MDGLVEVEEEKREKQVINRRHNASNLDCMADMYMVLCEVDGQLYDRKVNAVVVCLVFFVILFKLCSMARH